MKKVFYAFDWCQMQCHNNLIQGHLPATHVQPMCKHHSLFCHNYVFEKTHSEQSYCFCSWDSKNLSNKSTAFIKKKQIGRGWTKHVLELSTVLRENVKCIPVSFSRSAFSRHRERKKKLLLFL